MLLGKQTLRLWDLHAGLLRIPVRGKGSKIRPRKFKGNAVAIEASANPLGAIGPGKLPQSCWDWGKEAGALYHTSTSYDVGSFQGGSVTWARHLPLSGGNSWEKLICELSATNCLSSWELRVFGKRDLSCSKQHLHHHWRVICSQRIVRTHAQLTRNDGEVWYSCEQK